MDDLTEWVDHRAEMRKGDAAHELAVLTDYEKDRR